MTYVSFIAGLLILIVVLFDFLYTTLYISGGGIITSKINKWLWSLCLRFRDGSMKPLEISGVLLLTLNFVIWVLLSWAGWTLIFYSGDNAVVTSYLKEPADFWSTVYFSGFSFATLGTGNYIPNGNLWEILSVIASIYGFVLITLTISYLVPLVSAVVAKKKIAGEIHSLGNTAEEIVVKCWDGRNFNSLSSLFLSLAPKIIELGQQYLAYPFLHYYHSPDQETAVSLAITKLDEALNIIEYGVTEQEKPDSLSLRIIRNAITYFLAPQELEIDRGSKNPGQIPSLSVVADAGISVVSEKQFQMALDKLSDRRKMLMVSVEKDGWEWDDIVNPDFPSYAKALQKPYLLQSIRR